MKFFRLILGAFLKASMGCERAEKPAVFLLHRCGKDCILYGSGGR